MDTVMLRSGKVVCILGSNIIDTLNNIVGYNGVLNSAASTTGSIAGNILTVTTLGSGGLWPGNVLAISGILPGTYIREQLTGTPHGVGTYLVTNSQTVNSGTITADGSGLPKYKDSAWGTFQSVAVTSAGNVTATVNVYGSNDAVHWCATALGTITLASGASPESDGFTTVAPWKWVKAVLSNLTGTNAGAYVLMGI
jgi:hypothetical protein